MDLIWSNKAASLHTLDFKGHNQDRLTSDERRMAL
jgi:hypothetical protein